MATKWIKLIPNDHDAHLFKSLLVNGMRNPSHFIQTSSIKLISQMYMYGYSDLCHNIINNLMEDVSYCMNNKLALLELTESFAHHSAKDLLIKTHVAIRNIWSGLRDNNPMICQRAREVLNLLISKNMESVIIFDLLENNSELIQVEKLLLSRLNEHIVFLLERSDKMAIINSIRIISHVVSDNDTYINWVVESLNCLNPVNSSLMKETNNPFCIINEHYRAKFADSIYLSVIEVLISISKKENSDLVLEKVYWTNFLTEYILERLKTNIPFNILVYGKYLILLENLLVKSNRYYELYDSIVDIICFSLQESKISYLNRVKALNILGIIYEKSKGYSYLVDRLSSEIIVLSRSDSWELKESTLQFIINLSHIEIEKFESIVLANDLYLLPYQLLIDQEPYVRASALQCLVTILNFKSVFMKYLDNSSVAESLISHVLLKKDEDPNVRINTIKLLSLFLVRDSILDFIIEKGYLNEEAIQTIVEYAKDNDWEVRNEYLQLCYDLLINPIIYNRLYKDIFNKFGFDREILNAIDDPIRLVREHAYKLLKDINSNQELRKLLDHQLSQFISEISSIDFDLEISMQSASEIYDPDDEIYPLEPSYVENSMDCPF